MNWNQLLCEQRQCPSKKRNTDERNEFQRDYHRIVGSASFRRLQDKTQVFPIRFLVTYSVKDGVITAFEDLQENPAFEGVDFNEPVGLFRHDAIKELSKSEYKEKQQELYAMFDRFTEAVVAGEDYPAGELEKFHALLSKMTEPSLKPFYRALYPAFYANFME